MATRSIWLRFVCVALAAVAAVLVVSPASAAPDAPEVAVCHPVSREVVDFDDFTGRVEAVQSVDIRARVSGYLTKILFKEGSTVKRGDLLFEIDPRPYQAQLDQAASQVTLYQAALELAEKTLTRYVELAKSTPGAISPAELDQYHSAVTEAKGRVLAAKTSLNVYQLNVDFTHVRSPIDGKIGRAFLSVGNLVQADTTQLTTLVSVDPVYVYFDMDERTVLRRVRQQREGKAPSDLVAMALADEKDWPRKGKFDSADNRVDPNTGTLRCRAVFPNPDGILMPGMFARVRLAASLPYKSLLVPESAIQSGDGVSWVLLATENNTIVRRDVTLGSHHPDLRAVKEGLTVADRVVVNTDGIRKLDFKTVKPKLVEIPDSPAPKRPQGK